VSSTSGILEELPRSEMMEDLKRRGGSHVQIRKKTRMAGAVHRSGTTMRLAVAIARNTASWEQAMPIAEGAASTGVVTDGAIDLTRGLAHAGYWSVTEFHTRTKVRQRKKKEEGVVR
jgi:hypothetical protein